MFDRLDQLEARYEDLGKQMSDPTLVNDQKKFQSVAKQHRDMEPTVEKFRADELAHRDEALAAGAEQAPAYEALTTAIKMGSRLAIWLSTRI